MRRDKRIFKEFDQDKIKIAVGEAIQEVLANPDWYALGSWGLRRYETQVYMLDIFAPDWLGVHQAKAIIEQFGLRLKLGEYVWDDIDRIFGNVADLLNKAIPLSHPEFGNMWLSFGHGEGSPDWGLQLLFELAETE